MEVYWLEQRAEDVPADHGWLSTVEAATVAAMRIPKRRDDWRLGRWTAKCAVAAYMQRDALALSDIELRLAPSGAPVVFLVNTRAPLTISLSHREGRAICAVTSSEAQLGCDLEVIERRSAAFAADYFTPAEQSFACALGVEHHDAALTLMWSLKECALKALQVGLRQDVREIEVAFLDHVGFRHSIVEASARSGDRGWQAANSRTGTGQVFPSLWQRDGRILRAFAASNDFRLVALQSSQHAG